MICGEGTRLFSCLFLGVMQARAARLRYTLDRDSEAYKAIYRQRTAVERINSQAVALGIERPHLRNGQAIATLRENTLIYVLINLRFLQRLRQGLREDA